MPLTQPLERESIVICLNAVISAKIIDLNKPIQPHRRRMVEREFYEDILIE
jgi:hypothetical protein